MAHQLRRSSAQDEHCSQRPEAHRHAQGPRIPTQKNLSGCMPASALVLSVAVQTRAAGATANDSSGRHQEHQQEARPGRGGRHSFESDQWTQLGAEQEQPRGQEQRLTGSEVRYQERPGLTVFTDTGRGGAIKMEDTRCRRSGSKLILEIRGWLYESDIEGEADARWDNKAKQVQGDSRRSRRPKHYKTWFIHRSLKPGVCWKKCFQLSDLSSLQKCLLHAGKFLWKRLFRPFLQRRSISLILIQIHFWFMSAEFCHDQWKKNVENRGAGWGLMQCAVIYL